MTAPSSSTPRSASPTCRLPPEAENQRSRQRLALENIALRRQLDVFADQTIRWNELGKDRGITKTEEDEPCGKDSAF